MLTVKGNPWPRTMFLLAMLVMIAWSSPGGAETNVLNIRHWAAPDHTRVVIDTSEEAQYRIVKQDMRLGVEIDDARYVETRQRAIVIRKPGLDKIAVSAPAENRVLVDLYLAAHTETKVFRVKRFEDKPDRIVIDIILPEVEKKERADRERVKEHAKGRVIVIDPGHGGEDPGAIGRRGLQEKKVVLEIAKKVRAKLNARKGYHAFLTREGDYYVSFKKRLKIAREYGADLFLSIHADAARSRRACGSSAYVLSLRGASNEAARILARNENLADIVGGAGNGEGTSEESDPIILNMFQTQTMNYSKNLGNILLKNMAAVNRLKFPVVQEAPFMVLKLPEVPSILVETAYITNPAEEKKLRSRKFQNEIATAIAESAVEYLSSSPRTPPVVLARQDSAPVAAPQRPSETEGRPDKAPPPTQTEAPPGEAAPPAQTEAPPGEAAPPQSEAAGRETASGPRETAAKTIPPSPGKEPPPTPRDGKKADKKSAPVFHMVKRGESVDRIARRYRVSPLLILKANNMKPRDPLYTNRKIIIPTSDDDGEDDLVHYAVVKGDSLERIAARHGTTCAALMKINGMKAADVLYAGKRIKVPAPAAQLDGKKRKGPERATPERERASPARVKYRVKKGDSLETIAARHGTTLASLLRLNDMKARDTLHAGRVIILREAETDVAGEAKKVGKRPERAKKTVVYIVKKGDSLETIARRHRTTVGVLRDLNADRRLTPLYVNQRLKIPLTSRM
ncbi:MAG: N-acetylmuramoyl-L-alanine amidase [Pseudomonadota bacterium]|nr:N-acetylmuramoyl-L-alanine amidase [Pseudomonadota bacterium]